MRRNGCCSCENAPTGNGRYRVGGLIRWTLRPAAVLREVREETGYDAEVLKLIACYDRDAQGHHPALPVAVYKLFFLCRMKSRIGAAQNLETLDVGWFALNELPPLSEGRVLSAQLSLALDHYLNPSLPIAFD